MASQLLIPYLKQIDILPASGYSKLTVEEKQLLYEFASTIEKDSDFTAEYSKLRKMIYQCEPPTPQQFLDWKEGWLPKQIIDSIYDHIKEDFYNITDKNNKYYQVSMYGSTRLGKTFLARLLVIYTIIYIHCLREPALYYKLSPLTNLAIYFVSFKFAKTTQLYLGPTFKILEKSERFHKVTFRDQVKKEQDRIGITDKIVYSRSALVGEITLMSGLQILLGNDNPNEILGADLIQSYISEIAFFVQEAGASEDEIFQLYTDSLARIKATVGNDYLAYVYLDTSANFADSIIEKHIIENLQFDENTYFRWRSQWQARPYLFPKWQKSGETFRVIAGNGDIPASIVTDPKQIYGIPPDLIIDVPIDAKNAFELNLIKSIKDMAGRPTSKESKFVQDSKLVDILFNNPHLKGIEGGVVADAKENPTNLLWNKTNTNFFEKINDKGTLMFYRAPKEPRIVTLDVAFSAKGDVYGFCMGHLEYSRERKCKMAIVDFIFPILSGETGINLTSIEQYIYDLKDKGNVPIVYARTDSFQSIQMKQNLERMNVAAEVLSVDRSIAPYQELYTALLNETVKSSKNIFLKNNLLCLERTKDEKNKEKIDHPKGQTNNKYYGDWNHSQCGVNAKDVSDTLASFVYTAFNLNLLPGTIYEDENQKYRKIENDTKPQTEKLVHDAFTKMNLIYQRRL